MKNLQLFILLVLFQDISAQCIAFTYDAAGDRTARNICPQPIAAPSGQTHLATADITWQEINDTDINLYPNPTYGIIQIRSAILSRDAEMLVTDILGRVMVINKKVSTGWLDLSDLQAGRYFVRIVDDKKYKVLSVIKAK